LHRPNTKKGGGKKGKATFLSFVRPEGEEEGREKPSARPASLFLAKYRKDGKKGKERGLAFFILCQEEEGGGGKRDISLQLARSSGIALRKRR